MLRHVTHQRWDRCSTRKASSQCDVTHFVCVPMTVSLEVESKSQVQAQVLD